MDNLFLYIVAFVFYFASMLKMVTPRIRPSALHLYITPKGKAWPLLGREPGGPTHPSAHASVRHARGLKLAVQVEAFGRRIQHNAGIVTTNVVKLAVQVETHGRRIQLKAGNVTTVVVKLAVQVETLGRRIQLEAGIVAADLKFQQPRLPGRLRTASHGFSASAKTGAGQLTAF